MTYFQASFGLALALAMMGTLIIQPAAQAELLVEEIFDVPDVPGEEEYLKGQPTGTGLTGTWAVEDGEQPGFGHQVRTLEAPLSYGDFEGVGRSARGSAPWQESLHDRRPATATLSEPIASNEGTLWMGLLYNHRDRYIATLRQPVVSLRDSSDPDREATVHFRRRMDGARRGVLGVTLNDSGSDGPFIGYESANLPAPEDRIEALPAWLLSDDRTFFVLARFDLAEDGAWAYLNVYTDGELPDEEPMAWDTWAFLDGGFGEGGFDTLLLGGASRNERYDIGQIRIGTTMQDVLIPEPASLSLLGLGGAVLLGRWR